MWCNLSHERFVKPLKVGLTECKCARNPYQHPYWIQSQEQLEINVKKLNEILNMFKNQSNHSESNGIKRWGENKSTYTENVVKVNLIWKLFNKSVFLQVDPNSQVSPVLWKQK